MSAHSHPNSFRTACGIASIGILLASAPAAQADQASRAGEMQIETLKSVYLGCEQSASASRLGTNDAMYCSFVYEELKRRAFGGDFRRIRSWLIAHSTPTG